MSALPLIAVESDSQDRKRVCRRTGFSVDGSDWSTKVQAEQDLGPQLSPDRAYELAGIAAEHNESLGGTRLCTMDGGVFDASLAFLRKVGKGVRMQILKH
jgi:hypothetical protein